MGTTEAQRKSEKRMNEDIQRLSGVRKTRSATKMPITQITVLVMATSS